ncbi:LRR receptor-like serine threonine-protein kinase [Seminavis robusta]|uniref:LRR receptor-like serine threonine-protein kinase n=1 Tax=Seminavis robusta TaxID=568900 RepID=A0A9N8E4M8_9STRA|nr:LRR receptor-like serine threonine-protein kinase [Seminavis robusta]|eukprot:Sro545_g163890.1 LRR receptor-like serine threonine-protein kinase (795) ;mRNA; r:37002-40002
MKDDGDCSRSGGEAISNPPNNVDDNQDPDIADNTVRTSGTVGADEDDAREALPVAQDAVNSTNGSAESGCERPSASAGNGEAASSFLASSESFDGKTWTMSNDDARATDQQQTEGRASRPDTSAQSTEGSMDQNEKASSSTSLTGNGTCYEGNSAAAASMTPPTTAMVQDDQKKDKTSNSTDASSNASSDVDMDQKIRAAGSTQGSLAVGAGLALPVAAASPPVGAARKRTTSPVPPNAMVAADEKIREAYNVASMLGTLQEGDGRASALPVPPPMAAADEKITGASSFARVHLPGSGANSTPMATNHFSSIAGSTTITPDASSQVGAWAVSEAPPSQEQQAHAQSTEAGMATMIDHHQGQQGDLLANDINLRRSFVSEPGAISVDGSGFFTDTDNSSGVIELVAMTSSAPMGQGQSGQSVPGVAPVGSLVQANPVTGDNNIPQAEMVDRAELEEIEQRRNESLKQKKRQQQRLLGFAIFGFACLILVVTVLVLALRGSGDTTTMAQANVTYLAFNQNGMLTGQIPSELAILTTLQEIQADRCSLSGSLPTEFGHLTNVRILYVNRNNDLEGTIPTEFGLMTSMNEMSLNQNKLSGSLPSELLQLTKLNDLQLAKNKFTGTIPAGLGLLTRLTDLRVQKNQLSGTVPSELGLLTRLTRLNFGHNNLQGEIPPEIALCTNLEFLYLTDSSLSGPIPSECGLMMNVTSFVVFNNNLSFLPRELWQLTNMDVLRLNGNQFNGPLPSDIGRMKAMVGFQAFDNFFTGALPSELALLTGMTALELHGNLFSGSMPNSLE